jgi:hypothetical protein
VVVSSMELFVILSGTATVSRRDSQVATLSASDYFGELALLDPTPRNATIADETPLDVPTSKRARRGPGPPSPADRGSGRPARSRPPQGDGELPRFGHSAQSVHRAQRHGTPRQGPRRHRPRWRRSPLPSDRTRGAPTRSLRAPGRRTWPETPEISPLRWEA